MMNHRIIPTLLLYHESLVKTKRFKPFTYVGDPCNTARIFNELEVDELMLLDIGASRDGTKPNFNLLADIASECFMPLSYGGGVRTLSEAKQLFDSGFEKVVVNTCFCETPSFAQQLAKTYGSQAVIAAVDYRKNIFGRNEVVTRGAMKKTGYLLTDWLKQLESLGVGEILLTSVDREGTWAGLDFDLLQSLASQVSVPLIAHGGANSLSDVQNLFAKTEVSAVALGSLITFQKKGMGVLINMPEVIGTNQTLSTKTKEEFG